MGSARIMDVPIDVPYSVIEAIETKAVETQYVAINLDIAEGDPEWSGLTYGPFDDYLEAVAYGDATMKFFAVNELIKPT